MYPVQSKITETLEGRDTLQYAEYSTRLQNGIVNSVRVHASGSVTIEEIRSLLFFCQSVLDDWDQRMKRIE